MAKEPSRIEIDGETAYVTLTKGLRAIIDASDIPLISGYCWYASIHRSGHAYAERTGRLGEKRNIAMHRMILGMDEGGRVDHADGDGLNNRRSNLRDCSHAENMRNRVLDRRNKIGRRGVWTSKGRYRACIKVDGHTKHLGTYATAEEAAAAYKGAAIIAFGKFAPADL